jgi:Flp pilus assembly protein TadB
MDQPTHGPEPWAPGNSRRQVLSVLSAAKRGRLEGATKTGTLNGVWTKARMIAWLFTFFPLLLAFLVHFSFPRWDFYSRKYGFSVT